MLDTKSDPKLTSETPETTAPPVAQRTESRQALPSQAVVPDAVTTNGSEPATEEVAALAYQLWVERGSPHGSHEEDWYRAEQELRGSRPLIRTASR